MANPSDVGTPDWANTNPAAPPSSAVPDWAAPTSAPSTAPAHHTIGEQLGDFAHGVQQWSDKLGHDIEGGFNAGMQNGFGGFVARKLYENSDVGMDVLAKKYPNASHDELKARQKQVINSSVQDLRQQANDEMAQGGAMNIHIPNPFDQTPDTPDWATGAGVAPHKSGFDINPASMISGIVGGADPTLAIPIPGGQALAKGVMGTVGNMARSAVGHAAFGGTTDLAYQTADVLDGLQKDYDANRFLSSAAGMGALGVVSPFVHGLMKSRGVDTKPAEDPAGVTTPLTGQPMDAATLAQYRDVLATGSHPEIRKFFEGRNIQPPSHTDIQDWISRRDGGDPRSELNPDELTQNMLGTPDHRQGISDYIDNLSSTWKRKPDVEVINHTDDIADPEVRAAAKADNADEGSLGFYGKDGKVRIFADKVAAADDPTAALHAVLYHEALGHHGLAERFGAGLDRTLQNLDSRNVGQFSKDVDQWMKDNPGAYNGSRIRAAEEVLAQMSENGPLKKSLGDALVGHMRRFGRAMGMDLSWSDAEVRNTLRMAHEAVIHGTGRDARTTGFSVGDNGNRFMFTGARAKDFNPGDKTAFRAPDGFIRNEISDKDSRLIKFPVDGPQKLSSILKHDRLYEQYPQLADMTVHGGPYREKMGLDGGYAPSLRSMVIDNTVHPKLMHGAIIHELQHAIQHIEGHSNGVNAGDADVYRRSLGEIEARSAEARMHLPQDELPKSAAYASQGVKRNEVIVTPAAKDSKLIPPAPPGSRVDVAAADSNRFMKVKDLKPRDVAEEAFDRLGRDYVPGVRTHDQAQELAANSPLSADTINRLRGVGNLDRSMFILDKAAKEANDELRELHSRAVDGVMDPEDHARSVEVMAKFNYILGRIENDASQIARGLNAMKAVRFSRNNLIALKNALEAEGTNMEALADPDTMNKFLKQYVELSDKGNPAGAQKMLKAVVTPYWWQYLLTFRQNMMLSGLSTHLKSTMDMATMAGREIQETALALPGSAIRNGLRAMGADVKTGVHPTELASHLWGLVRAAMDAKTWADMDSAWKGKNQQPMRYANVQDPRIPGVSKVTDLVSVQDSFFRSFLNNAHLYKMGARRAYEEMKLASKNGKVDWGQVMDRGAAYAQIPSREMLKEAEAHVMDQMERLGKTKSSVDKLNDIREKIGRHDEAIDMTENTILLNRAGLNKGIDKLRQIRPNMSAGEQTLSFITNMLTPFIRIGANALNNQIIRRSPLSFLDKMTREDWAAGGARADIATMRTLMGTALMLSYWNAADPKKGKVNGDADSDYNKLQEKMAGGYSPNSIHDGNTYQKTSNLNLSLNPFDQHNQIATMVAGMRQAYEEGKDAKNLATGVTMAFNHVLHTLANETFLADLKPSIDAVTDKHDSLGVKLGKVVGEQARTFTPNALTQVNNSMIDTQKRDLRTDNPMSAAVNPVLDAIPGASKFLPHQNNVYGEPAQTGTTLQGMHLPFVGGNHTTEPTDPAQTELSRLAGLTKAAIVTPVPSNFKIEHLNVHLTTEQREDYQHQVGQAIQEGVRSLQQNGQWDKMSDQDRVQYVRDTQKDVRSQIKDKLIQTPDWINKDQIDMLRKKLGEQ